MYLAKEAYQCSSIPVLQVNREVMQDELRTKDAEMADYVLRIAAFEEQCASFRTTLAERDSQIKERQARVAALDGKLLAEVNKGSDIEMTLQDLRKGLAAAEAQTAFAHSSFQVTLAERDSRIQELQARVASLDQKLVDVQEHDSKTMEELAAIKKAHAPCADTLAARDAQIKELMQHLARVDKQLAAELEKEEALAKELAEEKRKEAELEQSLKMTKTDLEKGERDLAEYKKVRARGAGG